MLQAEFTTNRDGDEFFHVGGRVKDAVNRCEGEIVGIASEGVVCVRPDDGDPDYDVTVNYLFAL